METTKDLVIGNTEEGLFSRMLDIGVDPEIAKKIMSFWMFLASKGLKNAHEKIFDLDDYFLRCACAETQVVLAFLERQRDQGRPISLVSCPITWSLASPYLSRINVLGDKEEVSKEVLAIQDKVYNIAFEDILDKRGIKGKEDPNASDEGTSESREIHASKLNPFAEEWNPTSTDKRCLFMTFSRGYPLFKDEIINYFQRKYGDCVEDIFIHMPRDKGPEFGRIVFKFSWIPILVLGNKEYMKLYIGRKTICFKKYKPL